ncbi:MAG: hypothetical protein ACRDT6_29170 [Micromonosporaceae bacterium]
MDQYSDENWRNGVGTVYLTGQSTYRGDLALIEVVPSRSSTHRMYVGDSSSSTAWQVRSMSSRRAAAGDGYCTSGRVSGALCGWEVDAARVNVKYDGGEVVRNVTVGYKTASCTRPGDSGSPVYRKRTDSGVNAVGIHSGHGGGGGDFYGGIWDPCKEIHTDIWDAYYAFPGTLRTA